MITRHDSDVANLRRGDLVWDELSGQAGSIVTPPTVQQGTIPDGRDPAWDCVMLRIDGQAILSRAYNLRLVQRMGVN